MIASMFSRPFTFAATILALAILNEPVAALNPACAPGGNFDLGNWNLQLPVGSYHNPTAIPGSQLRGCSGYDDQYFFTDSGDGTLVMKVPGSPSSVGCVTTPGSKHCRTELREINPGSWDPRGPNNVLSVTLQVQQPDDSSLGTVIGQIHIDDSVSSKPVCELYYSNTGDLTMGIEQTQAGNDQRTFLVGNAPVGQLFSYTISYSNNVLEVSINSGQPTILPTFELGIPMSYFKVGNYNQGDSPSTVKFHSISVSHSGSGSQQPPATRPHAAAKSTIIHPGIGPVEFVTIVQHTVQPAAATSAPEACDRTPPTKGSDDTVTLKLYADDDCCNSVEHIKIGNLDTCHDSDAPFTALQQAVGADLFGQEIHIIPYIQSGCLGSPDDGIKLTNENMCWPKSTSTSGAWLSFKVAKSSSSTQPGCAAQPDNVSDDTVTLELYPDGSCCSSSVETIKIGNTGVCHKADQTFSGFTQHVGKNLFGNSNHVLLFPDASCSSSTFGYEKLTNQALHCVATSDSWNSFMVAPLQVGPSGSTCDIIQPDNPSDTTVSLNLFAGGTCCTTAFETIKIGNLDVCHNSNQDFSRFTQAVGESMFGRSIHVLLYPDRDCSSPAYDTADLSNRAVCVDTPSTWKSFKLASGPITGTSPTCEVGRPENSSPDTMALQLFGDASCCTAVENITIGVLNKCHKADEAFGSLFQAVGSNLFDHGYHIQAYTDSNCEADGFNVIYLSNKDVCDSGNARKWQSFKVASPIPAASSSTSSYSYPPATALPPTTSAGSTQVYLCL